MIWLYVGAALLVARWLISTPTPLRHRALTPERLVRLLTAFYHRGFDGAEFRLAAPLAPGTRVTPLLVLRKQILAPDNVRFVAALPTDAISELTPDRRERLRRRLGDWLPGAEGLASGQVLELPFAADALAGLATLVAQEGFGVAVERDGVVTLHDLTPRDARIGWSARE